MNTNTKKAVIDCLINQDSDKLSTRLSYLLADYIVDILANDKIVVDIVNKPTFENIRELRSFANDIGKDLTAAGIQCAECNGTLDKCNIGLDITNQQIIIRYNYSWQEDKKTKNDYDCLCFDIDDVKDNKEFEFKTI